jgi:O-acetyl-ADP-ribose deacetylase (regulator of RNase III)
MVVITKGNILQADAEALVNTVNCVGYMGKGIALQFKQAFPENFKAYERACKAKQVQPGQMFVFEIGSMIGPKYVINFPTKQHWRGKSKMEDIQTGLKALVEQVKRLNIKSIAVPPLGCGLGGLDWNNVRPLIKEAFLEVPDVQVFLYPPTGTPDAKNMPVRTKKPHMTVARALFIKIIQKYKELAYRLTLLEIQKLAYFLQETGEPLRLNYEPGHYGPYARNLNKVLEILEGHYIQGYGDSQKPDAEIELISKTVEAADRYLANKPESVQRLERVADLIEGFETPYGMELLSSVHWVAVYFEQPARDQDSAVQAIHGWNERKNQMFRVEHIRIAWQRLEDKGWIKHGAN